VWISARTGHAVVEDGADFWLLTAGGGGSAQRARPADLGYIVNLAPGSVWWTVDRVDFEEVQRELDSASRQDQVLLLALMSLDKSLSHDVRSTAGDLAAPLLKDDTLHVSLRCRLLGTPLPEIADVAGAPLTGRLALLIDEAWRRRGTVAIANRAWETAGFRRRANPEWLQFLRRTCILRGGFAALVEALEGGCEEHFESWMADLLRDSPTPEILVYNLLREWKREASIEYLESLTADHARADYLERLIGGLLRKNSREKSRQRLLDLVKRTEERDPRLRRAWTASLGRFPYSAVLDPARWSKRSAAALPTWYATALLSSLHVNRNFDWESNIQRWKEDLPWWTRPEAHDLFSAYVQYVAAQRGD
jgi:hypothetical protein